MDAERTTEMDIVVKIIASGLMVLVGLWVGVCIAAGTALIVVSIRERRWRRGMFRTVVTECPMCDSMGQVYRTDDNGGRYLDPCPLCDGEAAITAELKR